MISGKLFESKMRDWTLRGIESQSEDAMNSNGVGRGVVGGIVGTDVVGNTVVGALVGIRVEVGTGVSVGTGVQFGSLYLGSLQ